MDIFRMEKLAPIVLFVYKRPEHTRQTIEYLKKNTLAQNSDLFIFSEYPKSVEFSKDVEKVRDYLKTISGFKSVNIIERPYFLGLAQSVITGINKTFESHDRIIVLEDDIMTSPYFLEYMNEGLTKFEKRENVFSITGFCSPPSLMKIYNNYPFDIFLLPRASSWGWGTWKDRWLKADWEVKDFKEFQKDETLQKKYDQTGGDKSRMLINQMTGKLDSWAIRWDYTHYKNNAYGVFPVKSMINNTGLDNSGTHTKNLLEFSNTISDFRPKIETTIQPDKTIIAEYLKLYKRGGYLFKLKKFVSKFF